MLIFRATSLKYCYLHVLNFYLDNGVMTTPKRRILSFVFTVLKFQIANIILIAEALFLFWCKILFFIKVFVIYIFHPREVYFGRANLGKHETVVKLLAAVVFRRLH